jgi:hypothetical protein
MSYGASIYSYDCKPLITADVLRGTCCDRPGVIASSAPSQLESEPQLAMDRLMREFLAPKPLWK